MNYRNTNKAIAGTAILLFMYLPEILAWHLFPILCFKLLILLICLLPPNSHTTEKARLRFITINIILFIASIPYLFLMTYLSATLFLISFRFFALTIAVFAALYICCPEITKIKKILFSYTFAITFSACTMISAICTIAFLPVATPESNDKNLNLTKPALRYAFAVNSDGDKLLSCLPFERRVGICEIVTMLFPLGISVEDAPDDMAIINFCYGPNEKTLIGLEWFRGVILFDRKNFKIIKKNFFDTPNTDKLPRDRYRGIAYYKEGNEVLVGKADGTLIHLSYPDLKIVKKEMLLSGVYTRLGKMFPGDEPITAIFVSETNGKLIVMTNYGYVHIFDLKSHQITASRFLFCSLHNAVLSHDGKTFYVSSMMNGLVYRININDLSIVDVKYLGPGVRYMAIMPDKELLLVSNYLTGLVTLYDPPAHRVIATVATAPRIEWIEVLPETISRRINQALSAGRRAEEGKFNKKARYVCVQHGGGITWININRMMAKRQIEKPHYSFPLFVIKYEMNKGLNPLNYSHEFFKINAATMLSILCQIFCCVLFGYMFTRSKD